MRTADITRKTKETDIKLSLCLDGGSVDISTGIGFFDHMLSAFAVHGGFGLTVRVTGDLQVDCHHTIEDVGIVLGQAFGVALGDKLGITRFASDYVPMDEALSFCAVDIGNRAYVVFEAEFLSPLCGEFETSMAEEFMRAVAFNMGATLHIHCLYGKNDHHKIESIFKVVGRCLSQATRCIGGEVLSTKGVL